MDATELAVRAAHSVGAQPVGPVDREDEPVVGGLGLREPGERAAKASTVRCLANPQVSEVVRCPVRVQCLRNS